MSKNPIKTGSVELSPTEFDKCVDMRGDKIEAFLDNCEEFPALKNQSTLISLVRRYREANKFYKKECNVDVCNCLNCDDGDEATTAEEDALKLVSEANIGEGNK